MTDGNGCIPEVHRVESTHDYKVGDLVTLRSGGPSMVVTRLDSCRVEVAWTSDSNGLIEAWFPPACIRPVSE